MNVYILKLTGPTTKKGTINKVYTDINIAIEQVQSHIDQSEACYHDLKWKRVNDMKFENNVGGYASIEEVEFVVRNEEYKGGDILSNCIICGNKIGFNEKAHLIHISEVSDMDIWYCKSCWIGYEERIIYKKHLINEITRQRDEYYDKYHEAIKGTAADAERREKKKLKKDISDLMDRIHLLEKRILELSLKPETKMKK